MRSIQRRFNHFQNQNNNLSSFSNFTKAVRGQHFSKDIIGRWFNKLVEKDDFVKADKRTLIKHLVSLSKQPEEHRILDEIGPLLKE